MFSFTVLLYSLFIFILVISLFFRREYARNSVQDPASPFFPASVQAWGLRPRWHLPSCLRKSKTQWKESESKVIWGWVWTTRRPWGAQSKRSPVTEDRSCWWRASERSSTFHWGSVKSHRALQPCLCACARVLLRATKQPQTVSQLLIPGSFV